MSDSAIAFFEAQLATGEYPNISKLMRAAMYARPWSA
jgi:Arc/MetJ-type ribon-helix-helix transcriptional regulator